MWQIAVEEICTNSMQLNNYLNVRFTLKCGSKSINGFNSNLHLVLRKKLQIKQPKHHRRLYYYMRHLLFFSLELDITKDMAYCNVYPLIVELSIRTFILKHENTYFQFIHFIIIKSIYFKITYLLIFIHTILNYIKCYFSENNSYFT